LKAMVYTEYGSAEKLRLTEIECPVPGEGEVLVQVCSTALNSWDWELLNGTPFANRVLHGLRRPRRRILGSDVAGRVEALGPGVDRFQTGDEVLGDISGRWGGLADYLSAPQDALLPKPAFLSFSEAAALPQAGLLALQGLTARKRVEPGSRVLVNGAGGGAGTFAVQIAKAFGAEVIGVDAQEKADIMLSVGADHVFDYLSEDPLADPRLYDLILDFALHRSPRDHLRRLSAEGAYVVVGGSTARILQTTMLKPWVSMAGGRSVGLLVAEPNRDLSLLIELVRDGKVTPVIDRRYSLAETPDAFRRLGEGHAQGKLVIEVAA